MLLFFLSFFNRYVAAAPAASEFTPRADPSTTFSQNGSICGRRLMFSIVWGCLSTMFLCAWVSIHPNIPKPRRLEGIYRRFQLLFWMIVAPELILVLSMRQWVAAGRIADIYNDTKLKASNRKLPTWTRTHGHFIIMGGLTLISPGPDSEPKENELDYPDQPVGEVMSYEQFLHLANDPTFDFPIMTEADVNDRTRGDILSKSIAILQTTWFVIQCIARGVQHLAVTELELTTLGLCALSLMTYIFWWHKPLDAKTQVRVYLKPGQNLLRNDSDAISFDSTKGIWGQSARRGLLNLIKDIVGIITSIFHEEYRIGAVFFYLFFTLPVSIFCLLVIILLTPSILLFCGMMSMTLTTAVPDGASHVSPYYTPNTGEDVPAAVFVIFGAIFGGIHLIGWNFAYPTSIEQSLWRISATLITFGPAFIIFVDRLAQYCWGIKPHTPEARRFDIPKGFGSSFVVFLACVALILLVVCIFARFLLLVQSFVLLRRQPSSAFCSVDWILFFPHLS